LPFGGGVRRCVGAAFAQFEAKIVLDELTRALELRPIGRALDWWARGRLGPPAARRRRRYPTSPGSDADGRCSFRAGGGMPRLISAAITTAR
jgi:Cytochrome P450